MKNIERVKWRCRRGLLELDIVLRRFVDKHYAQLNEDESAQFEKLLDFADNDLWDVISARKPLADAGMKPVLHLLQKS